MHLNPGDKLRVLKEVYDKNHTIKAGDVLEVVWSKKKSMEHIRRCVDHKGRTRHVHIQDAMDGCFKKIYAAPVVVEPSPVAMRSYIRRKDLVKLIGKLNKQIADLHDSKNILTIEKAREISMILESKRAMREERDVARARNVTRNFSGLPQQFVDRLKVSMRDWVLAIQFSAPHSAMRKEIQSYLKELSKGTECITTDT